MSVILCTAGYDHTIRFWEALSGICSRTIQHPESQVNRLTITPDKRYLAAAGRHVVRLYDIKSSNPNPVMTFEGHTNNITAVTFQHEGKWMVTSSEDQTVKVWDTRTGALQRNYDHDYPVNDVVIHANQGELISADRGGCIRVWDLSLDKCTHQLLPEEDCSVASISCAQDGTLLAAGNNRGHVYIWRVFQDAAATRLDPICHFFAHGTYLTRLLMSPDAKSLATCSADHTVKIWKMDPESPDLLSDEYREKLELEPATVPQPIPSFPNSVASSFTTSNGQPTPSSLSIAQSETSANGAQSAPSTIANGHLSSVTPTIQRPLELFTTLEGHQRWVWDCAFSADSAYLVTVCSDHYARLWELATTQIIRQYNGHHRGAVCVALNDHSEVPPA